MKKIRKGQLGYVRSQRVKRLLLTLLLFALPIGLLILGVVVTGTRKNLLTIVAVVGILPAARCAVGFIMMMLSDQADPQVAALVQEKAPDLMTDYELTLTAYEGSMTLDAVTVCGREVLAFTRCPKPERVTQMQTQISKVLMANGFRSENVKIFTDLKGYTQRLTQIAAEPERYREQTRDLLDPVSGTAGYEEGVMQSIRDISL